MQSEFQWETPFLEVVPEQRLRPLQPVPDSVAVHTEVLGGGPAPFARGRIKDMILRW